MQELFIGDIEALANTLASFNIDISLYGRGDAKPVSKLLKEIEEGETILYNDNGVLVREITAVIVLIVSGERVLIEKKQVFKDTGQTRERDAPLAEKMKPGECYIRACIRGVTEELGSLIGKEPRICVADDKHRIVKERLESVSYPGLVTSYTKHYIEATVLGLPNSELFTSEEDHVTSYWEWQDITTSTSYTVQGYYALLDKKQ